jgi:hypothetical protein
MICPSCGFVNEDGVLFCDRCKADLDMPPAQSAHPHRPPSPAMNESADPIPLEPIALEPIALEPMAPGAEIPAIHLEPVEIPAPRRVVPEPVRAEPHDLPPLESTGDLPAVAADPIAPTPVPGGSAKLVVLRGQRMDVVYPLYPGKNYLGRTDDKPVDIDLDDQEASDRIWTSRQHAVINYENGALTIEDLNSLNGTFVNRARVHPGQLKELRENDVIQVGTVHLKVVMG